ncbi:MAG: ABC transporter ATP-binding protein [Gammaproteobacteria bacterium]|nr:ABC transporter ATP-binding protein [Gammaproteobacteria bacterium]
MAVLELKNLAARIGETVICHDLNIELNDGEVLGVLGRNGVGKTTLLHTIMNFHQPVNGSVQIKGNDIRTMKRQQVAREVGLLFQESDSSMPATVFETVLLGRHPYAENLLWDSEQDLAVCRDALALLGLESLANRQVSTLSGGEKQRLAISLLLVQNPAVFLLDEPSNHLDIDYQIKVLEILTQKVRTNRAAMVMASHDINLVSRFCNHVLLLLGDGEVLTGPAQEVLNTGNLERAFHCRITHTRLNDQDYFLPG